jgi:hypothetical protein
VLLALGCARPFARLDPCRLQKMTVRCRSVSWWACCVLSMAGFAPLFVSKNAHADVSSWMLVAGGAGNVPTVAERRTLGTLQLDSGFGSSPQGDWVVGGLVRSLTFFDAGTDLGLLLRTSTGGFSRGQWGLALDVGV